MLDVYKFLKRNTKLELIWDNNGKQIKFKSVILYVFEDRLYLSKPQNNNEYFEKVEKYDKLQVVVCTEEGVLSGITNLLEKDANEKGNIFISFPYNNQFCQRRENTRIPMHVAFDIVLGEENLSLQTKNISGKGLACLTNEPLPDFVDTNILLHMPSQDISIVCRKVYSKEIDGGQDKLYLNGVEFTDISEKDVGVIIKDCLKFQLDSKHNERLFETI